MRHRFFNKKVFFLVFFALLTILKALPDLNLGKGRPFLDPDSRSSLLDFTLPPGFSEKLIFQSDIDGDEELYLLSREGLQKLTDNNFPDSHPQFSPDGKKILYMARPGNYWQLFILTLATGKIEKAFEKEANFMNPCWAPDGKKIAFDTDIWAGPELASYDLENKTLTKLTDTSGENILSDWSPDGRTIAFSGHRLDGWRVYSLDLATKEFKRLTGSGNCRPAWSPDGKLIAYVSNNKKKYDIFLMEADGSNEQPVTTDPERKEYDPAWSRDGKRIYYHKSEGREGPPNHIWVFDFESKTHHQITRGPQRDFLPDVF